MAYEVNTLVRFAHTDPSGIVFYPRYFEMINNVIEDWFREGLGVSFNRLHLDYKIGVPTVQTECQFVKPSRLDDTLVFRLIVAKLGRSSITLNIDANCGDEKRLKARSTLVYTSLSADVLVSKRIPGDLREKITKYCQ